MLLLYSYIGIRISITIIVCVVIIIASIVVMIMIIISVVIYYHRMMMILIAIIINITTIPPTIDMLLNIHICDLKITCILLAILPRFWGNIQASS